MRDFVFVEDVIDIAMYFMTAGKSGIFNCGSGRAQPFNDVALTVVNSLSGTDYTLEEAVSKGLIEYIPFPKLLRVSIRPTPKPTSPTCALPATKVNCTPCSRVRLVHAVPERNLSHR